MLSEDEDIVIFPSSNLGAASFNIRLTNGARGGSTQWARSGGQRASGLAPLAFPYLLSGGEQGVLHLTEEALQAPAGVATLG